MKVVLFCGGLGTRLREHTDTVPKPMVNIGHRPMLWHLMKYYAYFGHTEFILCLGHLGEQIKSYFLNYVDWTSSNFQISGATAEVQLLERDIADWTITFVDTGIEASIGERLKFVESYLGEDDIFLANYSDGLSNIPLDTQLKAFCDSGRIAAFARVRPDRSFHTVAAGEDNVVQAIEAAGDSDLWINGGFFTFRREIFSYLREGEDLVEEPFQRLIRDRQLLAYPHTDFWACMDTYKDKKAFDEMERRGDMPWKVWESH